MTVEDSRKLLQQPDFYPSWVVFSRRQKLNWLNSHLTKIWPYVDESASELIRESVEPILEQYRPVILSSLKFSKFTLGTTIYCRRRSTASAALFSFTLFLTEVLTEKDLNYRVIIHYGIPATASVMACDPIQQLLAIGTL